MNFVDIAHLSLYMFLVLIRATAPGLIVGETKRMLAALTSLLLVVKTFDWLQLFTETAFYMRLIRQTIWDIKYFLIIFVMALTMFGLPMMFLNFGEDQEASLVTSVSGNFLLDSLLSQYI